MNMRFASSENVDVKKKIIIAFIFFLIVFFIDRSNAKYFSFFRAFVGDVSIYSSKALNYPFVLVSSAFENVSKHFEDDHNVTIDELNRLQSQIIKLENKNKSLETRNEYLNSIIGEEKYDYKSQIAKTVIYKNNTFDDVFSINRGSNDGVKAGDPIIKNNVLIGKVSKVNFKSSIAILLTNINSRVPVRIGTKKFTAILIGNPSSKNNLSLTFLPKEYSFKSGDLIYTSGIDGVLPERLLIGEIQFDQNKEFFVKPYYDNTKLDLVTIINLRAKNDK